MRPTESFPLDEGQAPQGQNKEIRVIEEATDFPDLYQILRAQETFEGQAEETIGKLKKFVKAIRILVSQGGSVEVILPAFLEPIPEGLHDTVKRLLKDLLEEK